jgi:hypothetical protein
MVKQPEISRDELAREPDKLWESFIKFLSEANTADLNDIQMAAQLPFWYDHSVRQGGHLPFFENNRQKLQDKLNVLIMATLEALKIIGADSQSEILARAADAYIAGQAENGCDGNQTADLEKFDNEYCECTPPLTVYLAKFLQAHTADFIHII